MVRDTTRGTSSPSGSTVKKMFPLDLMTTGCLGKRHYLYKVLVVTSYVVGDRNTPMTRTFYIDHTDSLIKNLKLIKLKLYLCIPMPMV